MSDELRAAVMKAATCRDIGACIFVVSPQSKSSRVSTSEAGPDLLSPESELTYR